MYFNFVIFVKALLKCNVRCWNFEKHSPKWLDASRIRIFTINPHLVCNIHKKQTNTRKTYNTVTMLTPKLQRIKKTQYLRSYMLVMLAVLAHIIITPCLVCNMQKDRQIQLKKYTKTKVTETRLTTNLLVTRKRKKHTHTHSSHANY